MTRFSNPNLGLPRFTNYALRTLFDLQKRPLSNGPNPPPCFEELREEVKKLPDIILWDGPGGLKGGARTALLQKLKLTCQLFGSSKCTPGCTIQIKTRKAVIASAWSKYYAHLDRENLGTR